MNIKALIFDVDGTLAETEEAHRAAFNETFADWGLDWYWSRENYKELLKTTGGKERIHAFQSKLSDGKHLLNTEGIAELHRQKTAAYTAILEAGNLELRPGVSDLIDDARRSGLKLAVATTTNTPNVDALCQCCWGKSGPEVFDHIAAGDMVDRKKPAPDVFLLTMKQLGLSPENCLAFEDSENGVAAAGGAGLRVVATPSVYTDQDNFRDATWVLETLLAHEHPTELAVALS